MRIAVYILILMTIGGLAGLYQLDSLMVLFLAGMVLFILLFILSCCLKGKISAEFINNQDLMNKGEVFLGTIKLTNPTRLPVVYLRLWLEWENRLTGQRGKEILQGACPPMEDTNLEYVWEAGACGEVSFKLTKIEVSDFFRLFKRKNRIEEKTVLLVLPPQEELFWSLGAPPEGEDTGPYQQGDRLKHIHWKLSARMDDLLVRHYHASAVPEAALYLELKTWPESEPEKVEAFLSRLAAVLSALLQEGWSVRLVWDSSRVNAEENEEREIAPEWSACTVRTQQEYLEAMGEVMEELGRRRKKLPKKKGRFGAVLDLYEKNEEKKAEVDGGINDGEEVLLQLNFDGSFYVNRILVEFGEEDYP